MAQRYAGRDAQWADIQKSLLETRTKLLRVFHTTIGALRRGDRIFQDDDFLDEHSTLYRDLVRLETVDSLLVAVLKETFETFISIPCTVSRLSLPHELDKAREEKRGETAP
jgi:hypothetical protein